MPAANSCDRRCETDRIFAFPCEASADNRETCLANDPHSSGLPTVLPSVFSRDVGGWPAATARPETQEHSRRVGRGTACRQTDPCWANALRGNHRSKPVSKNGNRLCLRLACRCLRRLMLRSSRVIHRRHRVLEFVAGSARCLNRREDLLELPNMAIQIELAGMLPGPDAEILVMPGIG